MNNELNATGNGARLFRSAGATVIVALAAYGLVMLGARFPCLAQDCAAQPGAGSELEFASERLADLEQQFSLLRRDLTDIDVARQPGTPERSGVPGAGPDTGLRADVEQLNAEVAGMFHELQRLRADDAGTGAPEFDARPGEPLAERDAQETAQHFAAIERRLADQDVDPGWSMAAADSIERALADSGLADVALNGIDCRSSLCRVDLGMSGSGDARGEELPALLLPALATIFSNFAMQTDTGSDGRIVYLWNE